MVASLGVRAVGEVEGASRTGSQHDVANHTTVDGEPYNSALCTATDGLVLQSVALLNIGDLLGDALHGISGDAERCYLRAVLLNADGGGRRLKVVGSHLKVDGLIHLDVTALLVIVAQCHDGRGALGIDNHDGGVDGVAFHAACIVGAVHPYLVASVSQAKRCGVDRDVVGIAVGHLSSANVHPLTIDEHVNLCGDDALVVGEAVHRKRLH